MGEARRRKLTGTEQTVRFQMPPYPDFGQTMWKKGVRDEKLIVPFVEVKASSDAPDGTTDVHFNLVLDDGCYCGTLNTSQTHADIHALIASEPIVVATLGDVVTGQGGERYRLLVGRLEEGGGIGLADFLAAETPA
jgi:hypothetical protein